MRIAVEVLAVVAGVLASLAFIPGPTEKPYWVYTLAIGLLLAAVSLFVMAHG